MDMSDMLNKLLSDPSAMTAAAELVGKMMQNSEVQTNTPASPSAETPSENPASAAAPANSSNAEAKTVAPQPDILSAMLNNPEFMQKIPQMMSAMAPMLQNLGAQNTPEPPKTAAQALPVQALPGIQKKEKNEQEKRNALLLALKPYLSPERAEAVDQIIRLTELIALFSLFK